MILLFIFIVGCFVTAIVALGVVFALAAAGYDAGARKSDSAQSTRSADGRPDPNA